jgi:hypothetical protein
MVDPNVLGSTLGLPRIEEGSLRSAGRREPRNRIECDCPRLASGFKVSSKAS